MRGKRDGPSRGKRKDREEEGRELPRAIISRGEWREYEARKEEEGKEKKKKREKVEELRK